MTKRTARRELVRDLAREGEEAPVMPQDVAELGGWVSASHGVDPASVRLPTRRITINLDGDVVATFKAEALQGGPPYQVAINQALRAFLRMRELHATGDWVRGVLKALDDTAVRRKIRSLASPLASPRRDRRGSGSTKARRRVSAAHPDPHRAC
jgi:uncharacterized protein (DUF4415 family)